jgi:hypothetical protein
MARGRMGQARTFERSARSELVVRGQKGAGAVQEVDSGPLEAT